MEQRVFDDAYERFVKQSIESGILEMREGPSEQREHPRFQLCRNIVWSHGDLQFSIVDLSISGISFDANQGFEPGRIITVRMSDLLQVTAVVVASDPVEPNSMFYIARNRVRCRFEDREEGVRFLLMVRDIQQLRIEV